MISKESIQKYLSLEISIALYDEVLVPFKFSM
jgi:hypothetical protein